MTNNMLSVARRNLRTFIGLASFKSGNDREAALNCLDVIEAGLPSEPTDAALLADIFAKMEEVLKPLPGEE